MRGERELAPELTGGYTHLAPFFVTAMVASSAILGQLWRHENQRLQYAWGMVEYKPVADVRPEFRGEKLYSFIKDRYEYGCVRSHADVRPCASPSPRNLAGARCTRLCVRRTGPRASHAPKRVQGLVEADWAHAWGGQL